MPGKGRQFGIAPILTRTPRHRIGGLGEGFRNKLGRLGGKGLVATCCARKPCPA
jgi:hypothetical protein